ncbi:hypothetical protein V8E53_006952 [Lactarius tabidus]
MYKGVIYFCSLSSSALLSTRAAPLPATGTDYNSLQSHSSSSAEAAIPHPRHVSRSAYHSSSPSSYAHKLFTIIFASIGGTLALLFLVLCVRRLIIHSRIPRQNIVLTDAGRARIVQEIAECEAASQRYWHSRKPPPPPYEHAPSYDLLVPRES